MTVGSFLTVRRALCSVLLLGVGLVECSASTEIVMSVPDQKLALVTDGQRLAEYKISTSRFGLGDQPRSYGTPLGRLEVAERIGAGLQPGAVLKCRQPTGEVLPVNAQGRDPIVTRILYLRGLEACNQNAHSRGIYIHGTPVERTLGKPDSWGCIRMRSEDVISLFNAVPVGTRVQIVNERMRGVLPGVLLATHESAETPHIAEGLESKKNKGSTVAVSVPIQTGSSLAAQSNSGSVRTSYPRHYTSGSSVIDLPSLGGVENLRAVQERDAQEHRGGIGLSVSLW